jgi:enterochelin esterase-like enzyme
LWLLAKRTSEVVFPKTAVESRTQGCCMRRTLILGMGLVLMGAALSAQTPAAPAGAAPGGQRGAGTGAAAPGGGRGRGPALVSPEVSADRKVTLRYAAPNAQQITVSGELDGKTYPMTKGENGVWSVTIGPLAPDIYTYSFNVDGVVALDPRNTNTKMGYGGFGPVSTVEVPGDGPMFYDVKNVPHGQVRIVPYVSKTLGVARNVWVYTPPDYEKGKNYPVVYLLHGAGDIESGWTLIGRANNILDNLIAENKAKPMVVVMPLGHAIQGFYAGPAKSYTPPAPAAGAPAGPPAPGPAPLQPFSRDLLEDVMPMIEKTFKVSTKADDRAIAGLSMGGGHTFNIAFSRPELFRWVVAMSPAANGVNETGYPGIFKDATVPNKQFKLLWMGVGKDDTLTGPGDKTLAEALTKAGIKHTFELREGRHEWTVWRHQLNQVAQLLFR